MRSICTLALRSFSSCAIFWADLTLSFATCLFICAAISRLRRSLGPSGLVATWIATGDKSADASDQKQSKNWQGCCVAEDPYLNRGCRLWIMLLVSLFLTPAFSVSVPLPKSGTRVRVVVRCPAGSKCCCSQAATLLAEPQQAYCMSIPDPMHDIGLCG